MTSLLGRLRSGNDAKGNNATSPASKKDSNAPQLTPLERMLENAGPIRSDGSDKFFGMENFGNTCYCNSILQILYFTPPFRENIVSFPQRTTVESLATIKATIPPRAPYRLVNGQILRPGQPPRPVVTPQSQPGQKPEDKDSPEYKKKVALVTGPIVDLKYDNSKSYKMKESMFTAMKDVFEAIILEKNRHGIVSPSKFLDLMRTKNEMFNTMNHQDAHEFLNWTLNAIIDDLDSHHKLQEKSRDQSLTFPNPNHDGPAESNTVSWPSTLVTPGSKGARWLRDMFEGQLTSETRCLACESTSHRDEPFLDLSVDLEQHSSVTSCLNHFSAEEMLCERDKFHCDNCGGLQEAEKRMKIKRLPQVLAVHLKRFKASEGGPGGWTFQKLFHRVVYPFHLRLFNTTDDAEDPDRIYELYAVVIHVGASLFHGHYVSVVKTEDRGWLLFDDEMVEPVDKNFVRNFFGDKSSLACAYVLFYRQTTDEAVRREQRMEGRRRTSQDVKTPVARQKESADLHRVLSDGAAVEPLDASTFPPLDHAMTAPHILDGHREPRPQPHTLKTDLAPASDILSAPALSKKDKAREEKERAKEEKAAEKERKAAQKAAAKANHYSSKDADERVRDHLKQPQEETSKLSRMEDDQRNPDVTNADVSNKDAGLTNGLSSSTRDIFRRSKSFRFGSLGRKDKSAVMSPTEELPSIIQGPSSPQLAAVVDEDHKEDSVDTKDKKNRFSIRKRSFGLLG